MVKYDYFEIQPHVNSEEQKEYNVWLRDMAKAYNIPLNTERIANTFKKFYQKIPFSKRKYEAKYGVIYSEPVIEPVVEPAAPVVEEPVVAEEASVKKPAAKRTRKAAVKVSVVVQAAGKELTEAEKILRECEPFKESITSFDYTGDGIKDYVCRMQRFFAVISRKGGSLRELDVFGNSGNFADNLNSVKEFEGYNDDYERGLFIDHLYDHKEFESYLENTPVGSGIFSKYVYNETKFSNSKKEIILESSALYKNRQKVNLIKKVKFCYIYLYNFKFIF